MSRIASFGSVSMSFLSSLPQGNFSLYNPNMRNMMPNDVWFTTEYYRGSHTGTF